MFAGRYSYPRDTPVAMLGEDAMKVVCDRLNGTPRKCLGWRTPLEAFREEMRNLGWRYLSQRVLSLQGGALPSSETPIRKQMVI